MSQTPASGSSQSRQSPEARRIIVTRPVHQAQSWSERITRAGYAQCAVPVLEIIPVSEPKQQQAIKNTILRLDDMFALIFVSQNAVELGFKWIDDYWPQLPKGLHYFAVGKTTDRLLQEKLNQFGESSAPSSEFTQMNSEELLQAPLLRHVENKKIAIFRGVGGRPRMAEELSARGAKVAYLELYERSLPPNARQAMLDAKINAQQDIVPVFSGESLENIQQLLATAQVLNWQNLPLIVPGERVAQLAGELGFVRVFTALNASEESMWETTQTCLKNLSTR